MLVRLLAKCEAGNPLDAQLVQVLRELSTYDYTSVIPRSWRVSDLDLWAYPGGGHDELAMRLMFPELGEDNEATVLAVTGERLFERSALVHQFESGLFLRIVDPAVPVEVSPDNRLWHGPPRFQASNIDLEIRCGEGGPFEVVSLDQRLIRYFQEIYAITEVEVP
jgi:hypothetical protein